MHLVEWIWQTIIFPLLSRCLCNMNRSDLAISYPPALKFSPNEFPVSRGWGERERTLPLLHTTLGCLRRPPAPWPGTEEASREAQVRFRRVTPVPPQLAECGKIRDAGRQLESGPETVTSWRRLTRRHEVRPRLPKPRQQGRLKQSHTNSGRVVAGKGDLVKTSPGWQSRALFSRGPV